MIKASIAKNMDDHKRLSLDSNKLEGNGFYEILGFHKEKLG